MSILKKETIYEDTFKNNKYNSKLIQLDGEIFIGEWKEGKRKWNS